MPIGIPRVPYRLPGESYGQWVDLYNRLYRDRVLFLGSDLDDELANQMIGILAYLNIENPRERIFLYINSMGGGVMAGLGVFDTMQYVEPPVTTICIGLAASMASFVLAGGSRGHRTILPHARVMIHQPSGGAEGQSTDIVADMNEIRRLRTIIAQLYSSMTEMTLTKVAIELDRDNFFSPERAKVYGIVDHVIKSQRAQTQTSVRGS
jgi:ATP-dependent Clp protease protease subunit